MSVTNPVVSRRSVIASVFATAGLAAQERVGKDAPISPKDNLKVTRLETFLVKPRWLFLKVHTNAGIVGYGEPITEVRLIAGMAEAYYASIAPHNPLGPISLAAGVQLAAFYSELLMPGAGFAGRGIPEESHSPCATAISTCPPAPASASSSTKTPWPTRSITTGRIRRATTPMTARWSTGSHPISK